MSNTLLASTCAAILLAAAAQAQAAFVVVDDFEDGNTSEYTLTNVDATTTSVVVGGAHAHDGALGVGINGNDWLYRTDAAATVSRGDTLSAWMRFDTAAPNNRAWLGFGTSSGGTLALALAPNTNQLIIQLTNLGVLFSNRASIFQTYAANKWYRAEVVWALDGSVTGNLYDSDGTTLLNTLTASGSDPFVAQFTSGGIGIRGIDGTKSFDTISIERATTAVPEPSTLMLLAAAAAVAPIGRCFRGKACNP